MKHLETLKAFTSTQSDLFKQASGKFYTPELVAAKLAETLLQYVDWANIDKLRIVDPFCGDGRLLVMFIREACNQRVAQEISWRIDFWDYDLEAVEQAILNLECVVEATGISAELAPKTADSFVEGLQLKNNFNFVITNPPWDTIKPDRRELAGLSEKEKTSYRNSLRELDQFLAEKLPFSQPVRKFAGWGTNLSRCGTELALELTMPGGYCGVIAPYSLLTDLMSEPLRIWMMNSATLLDVGFYPAEARLFKGVDQNVVMFTACKTASPERFRMNLTAYDRKKTIRTHDTVVFTKSELQSLNHSIPAGFGKIAVDALRLWQAFGTIGDMQAKNKGNLWLGRELDETRKETFLTAQGTFKFVKGNMVGRYFLLEEPSEYVDEEQRSIPGSAKQERIAWRDISRRSQARRMQAAIISPDLVAGNSLNVAYFRDGDSQKLKALLTIMNSIPFEFQVRVRLGTGHISTGVIRQIHVPDITNKELVRVLCGFLSELEDGVEDAEIRLEVTIAQVYNLDKSTMTDILTFFPALPHDFVSRLLSCPLWDNSKFQFQRQAQHQ